MRRFRLTEEQVALIKELKKRRRKASDRTIDAGVKRYFSRPDAKEMIDKYLTAVKKAIDGVPSEIEKSKKDVQ